MHNGMTNHSDMHNMRGSDKMVRPRHHDTPFQVFHGALEVHPPT